MQLIKLDSCLQKIIVSTCLNVRILRVLKNKLQTNKIKKINKKKAKKR